VREEIKDDAGGMYDRGDAADSRHRRYARAALLADAPVAHAAATCSDYPNQKAAQEAADTRDGDGDGIYCVISPR
jgi:hypothetical protein